MNRKRISGIAIYLFIFSLALLLYTHNNSFPFFYHKDEPTKIEQITAHTYNFNHPLLMLNSANAAAFVSGAKTPQEMVQAGRTVSAVYAALAILLLMGCAQMISGLPGAFISGVLMILSPAMIELSHYFKEDSVFLFGVSLSLFCFSMLFRYPNVKVFVITAAAAAVASSGKYVGFIFLPVGLFYCAVFSVYGNSGKQISLKSNFLYFVSVFAAVFAIINIQMILSLPQIAERLVPLLSHTASKSSSGITAFTGHGGVKVSYPILEYCKIFITQTTIVIPLLALGYIVYFFAKFTSRTAAEKLLVAFFLLFTIMLSFSRVASFKYFLPQELLSHLFAALMIGRLYIFMTRHMEPRIVKSVCAVIVIAVVLAAFPFARNAMARHSPDGDSRKQLISWLEKNSDEKLSIVSDGYVFLPQMIAQSPSLSSLKKLTVDQMEFTGDLGSMTHARELGYTHIAVAASTYKRFFDSSSSPGIGSDEVYEKRKIFYLEMFEAKKPVWEFKGTRSGVINESIAVYDIRPNSKVRSYE